MSLNNDSEIRESIQRSKNPFQRVNQISAEARKRAEASNNQIRHSEAITWVVQGIKPRGIIDDKSISEIKLDEKLAEMLCYIDDVDIQAALLASLELTLSANMLIFDYKAITCEYKQARVRILMRLLLYS